MKKKFGVLCHVSSLLSEYGIGDFGKSSLDFIDFLSSNKIDVWQVLPLTETNDYNCPYGSMCYFAFDTMYIDPQNLLEFGLIKSEDEINARRQHSRKVNYKDVKKQKLFLLEAAYKNITKKQEVGLKKFINARPEVVEYAYFKVLLEDNKEWDYRKINSKYWNKDTKEYKEFYSINQDRILKYVFWQYLLCEQWLAVKKYAKEKGVKILGDMPIYPSPTSFDVFANPKCFLVNQKTREPKVFGGVPADDFCADGQNWGSCIYDWDYLKEKNYEFIIKKVKTLLKNYDILRLDHYLGYVEHYEIDAKNPKHGVWKKKGGADFFNLLSREVSLKKLVVEDLGELREEPEKVVKQFDLKCMRVLQFARSKDSEHLPENVMKNCIFYLGTHDNNTFIGFLESLSKEKKAEYLKLLNINDMSNEQVLFACVHKMLESKSDLIVLQVQDLLFEGSSSRMNIPGKADGCWEYRLPSNYKERMHQNLKLINIKE